MLGLKASKDSNCRVPQGSLCWWLIYPHCGDVFPIPRGIPVSVCLSSLPSPTDLREEPGTIFSMWQRWRSRLLSWTAWLSWINPCGTSLVTSLQYIFMSCNINHHRGLSGSSFQSFELIQVFFEVLQTNPEGWARAM